MTPSDPLVSPQNLRVQNPMVPAGYVNLALGIASFVIALGLIYVGATTIQRLAGAGGRTLPPWTIVEAVSIVVGLALAGMALRQLGRGIGQLGTLRIPPRAPAEFSDYTAEVAVALQRQELSAYRLPKNAEYALAHRFFPQHFPLLSVRLRRQLDAAIGAAVQAAWWLAGTAAGLWALSFVAVPALDAVRPGFPIVFAVGMLATAVARVVFLRAQLPEAAPPTDREEFRFTMSGGGDPKLIPIGLEHELMALRPTSSAPNRGIRTGFALAESGVKDSGEFDGMIIVETQPSVLASGTVSMHVLMIGAAGIATVAALVLIGWRPAYLSALGAPAPADLSHAALIGRWGLRLIGAAVLLAASRGVIEQLEHFLGVFRFSSTAIAVRVQGTFGRAGIKVGKAIHDSIESDNVVVRSDATVVGWVALIESESEGLMGRRQIVSLRRAAPSTDARERVERWFEAFKSRGADIVGVDLNSAKVAQMVNANVAIDAQRAGARVNADLVARDLHAALPRGEGAAASADRALVPGEVAPATGAPATDLAADERLCPDCAERIKAAARKCRFCGLQLDAG